MKFSNSLGLACLALALAACGGGGSTGMDLGPPLDAGTDTGSMMTDAGHDAGTPDLGPMVDGGPDISALGPAQHAAHVAECACDPMSRGFLSTADCVTGLDGLPAALTCTQTGATAAPTDIADLFRCIAVAYQMYTTCLAAVTPACDATMLDSCATNLQNDQDACPNPAMASGTAYATARDACVATMITGTMADGCSDTATASMAVGDDVFHGTTVGAGDHRDPSCVTNPTMAPDVALRWTAPAAGTYTIDTIGSLFDTALYVMDGCGTTATELACNDDIDGNAGNYRSSVDVTLTAGQTVQIIVDGYNDAAAGDYHVNIHGGGATDGGVMDASVTDAGVDDGGTGVADATPG